MEEGTPIWPQSLPGPAHTHLLSQRIRVTLVRDAVQHKLRAHVAVHQGAYLQGSTAYIPLACARAPIAARRACGFPVPMRLLL